MEQDNLSRTICELIKRLQTQHDLPAAMVADVLAELSFEFRGLVNVGS